MLTVRWLNSQQTYSDHTTGLLLAFFATLHVPSIWLFVLGIMMVLFCSKAMGMPNMRVILHLVNLVLARFFYLMELNSHGVVASKIVWPRLPLNLSASPLAPQPKISFSTNICFRTYGLANLMLPAFSLIIRALST